MPPRKSKNSQPILLWLMLALMVFLPVFTPGQAHAYTFNEPDFGYTYDPDTKTGEWDGEVCPGIGLLRRIMPCIKDTVVNVTNQMLIPISKYAANTVTVMCTLAIALLGALMIGGKTTAPFKDTMVLIVKLAFIRVFTNNFGGFFGQILDVMDGMLDIVTNVVLVDIIDTSPMLSCMDYSTIEDTALRNTIWDAADCSLNTLVGGIVDPSGFTLQMGIIGFLVSALFSNTLGMAIGLLGIRLILQLIWALFRCLYIFVGSYLGICIMVLVSPFFIPTILFQATRAYFERWLRLLMSFMLQPVILFAYIAMLLTAFDLVIFSGPHSLYGVLAGDDANKDNFRKPVADGGLGGVGTVLQNGGYKKDWKSPFALDINSKGTKDYLAKRASDAKRTPLGTGTVDTGVMGLIASLVTKPDESSDGMNVTKNRQNKILNNIGLGALAAKNGKKSDLNLFEISIPKETVDWNFLAWKNGYNVDLGDTGDQANGKVVQYMIKVYVSFLMSLLTGYVFIELLDTLPFVGQGLALGSGIVDEKSLGMSGLTKMAPPGADFMKQIKGKTFVG